jgi:hypothetical protein
VRSIIAVMLLVVGLAGCSSDDPSGGGEQVTVVYELTGPGKVYKIRYNDVSTKRMAFVDEPTQLPWRKEITAPKTDYMTLSAIVVDDNPDATCKITVAGKEVTTSTDSGVVECRVG